MKKNSFQDFINQYELSKTLRFELKPTDATKIMLEENNVFQKDELIQKKYIETKKYFDRLHREFVKESLSGAKLTILSSYAEALKNVKKITRETIAKDKKEFEKILSNKEKQLRKEIVNCFNRTAKFWADEKYPGLKKKDIGILSEESVFSVVLKERYGNEKETIEDIVNEKTGEITTQSIFDGWKGFTGYFTKFFETRKNFYKSDGTSTALATRIVDQNLRRFCDNLNDFEKIKDKISFSEVEENFNVKILDVFSLDFYNTCLLQDGIDNYNEILGGKTLKNGEKLKGINELVNKYRQDNRGKKLSFLKFLDKQILSEKETLSFGIENEKELLGVLKEFQKTVDNKTVILKNLFRYFVNIKDDVELKEIYISKEAFNTISRKWTFETDVFEKIVYESFKRDGDKSASYKKAENKYIFPDFISMLFIKNGLNTLNDFDKFWKEKYYEDLENKTNNGFLKAGKKDGWQEFLDIFDYEFKSLFTKEIIDSNSGEKKIIGFEVAQDDFKNLLKSSEFSLNKSEKLNKKEKVIIKEFADSILRIYQMAKYFSVEKKRKWNPSNFKLSDFYRSQKVENNEESFDGYEIFYNDAYEAIVQKYNDIRNYLTKKSWEDAQKWKLNFENSTLAGGWDKNKEIDNFAIILRKEEKYFLGLMKKGCNYLFVDKNKDKFKGVGYEKMVYKLLPGANKMLPKVFFSKSNINFFAPSKKVLEIRNYSSHTKGGQPQKGYNKKDFNLADCHQLIDFFKESLIKHKEWKNFDFEFLKTSEYSDISRFYRDVEKGGYKVTFQNILEKYIEEKNENGELYLFQIKNKDWNEGSTGMKNLHTMYFENLFSQENIDQNFVFKLNGQAEIFYRPKVSADDLGYKKDKQGKKVINHKRYNEDKIFFHMPMALNRGVEKPFFAKFNKNLNEFLANNSDINIIGVDRGEKHLAYYSVIDQEEKILDSGTLNVIENFDTEGRIIESNEKEIVEVRNDKNEIVDYELKEMGNKVPYTDYKLLLEYKEKKRLVERQTWQTIEGIKDLKKGYISQIVKKLADLAIKHNAIIVFEDLNMRFKQIRGGIEKSVYQQLEKALIDKLNYLVNKSEKDSKKAGHLLKAYQLTAPFETFKDMGKQTGILFYTTASYTSKIDPVTGWRPNLYLKKGSAEKNKNQILNFSKIEFVNDRFEFSYDLEKFIKNKDVKFAKNTKWTVCSSVERFRWNRKLNNNKGGYDYYKNMTDNFKELFEKFGIEIKQNILKQIDDLDKTRQENKKFFSDFIFLFGLVCQIRNTDNSEKAKKDGKDDFILSPVEPFFDSRVNNGKSLPTNGDDNGAFNIARKGIITLKRIDEWAKENEFLKSEDKKERYSPDLFIGNIEWDNFVKKELKN